MINIEAEDGKTYGYLDLDGVLTGYHAEKSRLIETHDNGSSDMKDFFDQTKALNARFEEGIRIFFAQVHQARPENAPSLEALRADIINEFDPEPMAMQGVLQALRPLDNQVQIDRVLRWAKDRFYDGEAE